MAGLTADGFVKKTLEEITEEVDAELRAEISPSLNVSSTSVIGQVTGVINGKLAELWDLSEAVYNSEYPDSASDVSLAAVSAITGTVRRGATHSTIADVEVELEAGATLPAGSVAHVSGNPSARFLTDEEVTNGGLTDDVFTVNFTAETAGEVQALSGTLTEIAEPVAGWLSVTNPTDATVGEEEETDEALRLRRQAELASGSTTVDAIRSDILRYVEGVVYAKVLENDTDAIDAEDLPPHSIECIVYGPASPTAAQDLELATQIFKSKPSGITAHGSSTETVLDSQGKAHEIAFTRPTLRSVYVEVDVTIDSASYPVDGDDQIKAAIVAVGDTYYQPGDDVIAERLKAACFTVAGVVDVTALRLGFSASPVGTSNLSIAMREVADLDTGRVEVATS